MLIRARPVAAPARRLLSLAALLAIGLAAWWYYTAHHGSF